MGWRRRQALAQRVVAATGAGGGSDEPALDVALERWGNQGRGRLLIILDQFEEYLRLHGESEGGSFDRLFPLLVGRDDLPVNFLLSLRDDALSELDRYQGRMPQLFGNYLRLAHMSEESARAAITQPIARVNEWRDAAGLPRVKLEDGLVDEIFAALTDPALLSGQRGVRRPSNGRAPIELAFLQLVMRRLWEEDATSDKPLLKHSTLRRLGGVDAIVAGHLDAQMESLAREQRDAAAAMFGYLVTPSGAKIRYTPRDLAGYAQRPEGIVGDVLEALSRPHLRIIRRVPAPSGDPQEHGYEIFHDVLSGAVRGWGLRHRAVQLERQSRRLGAALAAAIAAIIALLVHSTNPWLVDRLNLATVDLRFGLRGVGEKDPSILIVGIDDRTRNSTIARPSGGMSRSDQARVLDAIAAGRPKVIVEDIEYKDKGEAKPTSQLKRALRSTAGSTRVVLATNRINKAGETTLFGGLGTLLNSRNSSSLLGATIGYSALTSDRADGAVRRHYVERRAPGGFIGLPTIATRAVSLADGKYAQTPPGGDWIDFAGAAGTYPHVSFVDVRNGGVPGSRFKDKVVIVGDTGHGALKVYRTAAAGGTRMPPSEIHANAIATERRGWPLRDISEWQAVALILALALAPAGLTLVGRPALALGLSATIGAAYLAGAQLAFDAGRILPIVVPLLALVLSIVASQVARRVWPGTRAGRAVSPS